MSKKEYIEIKGGRMHNLKNIDVKIPHGKFTVITGLSGSGKSTLAFDTLYAEGQRRYIESLSSYARQFLGKLNKPEADYIKGIAPAIAIEQKVSSTNVRSTVGTKTEIYDFLKVLFARAGKTFSPISGKEVKKHNVTDVVHFLSQLSEKEKCLILCPISRFEKYGTERTLEILKQQGFVRLFLDNKIITIKDAIETKPKNRETAQLVIDRIAIDFSDEDAISRYSDSISIAFTEGDGVCSIHKMSDSSTQTFSNRFELDGMEFSVPNEHFFTFNNPYGACKTCEGYGQVIGIDANLVIPNKDLSVYEGAVYPWNGVKMGVYKDRFVNKAVDKGFPIHRPVSQLTKEELDLLWNGTRGVKGIRDFFQMVESKAYKIQYRVLLSRYRGRTNCHECEGTRLRKDAGYVKIDGKSLIDIVQMPVDEVLQFFQKIPKKSIDEQILKRIIPEITSRLEFLQKVGLGYLTLNRASNTLSGGESQRIHLATSLGSSLVGSMYILDEPSIGLHPADTEKLISVLKNLRDLGNTVIVVEHEEDVMKSADEILDIGPKAGVYGGEIVFQGKHQALIQSKNSLTADYLTGKRVIPVPKKRRKSKDKIVISGARQFNLKNITAEFPLRSLVCVTGVSGSGKSTLVKEILLPVVRQKLGIHGENSGEFSKVTGDFSVLSAVEFVNQNPIGKSSRSNPITYVKAFDDIRALYARQPLAKTRGYKPGFFSFNVDGGRCEVCEGEGEITVGMQFMADIHLECENCEGTRYKSETLDILYQQKNISELLQLDLDEAFSLFSKGKDRLEQKIAEKIKPLVDVGLGYLKVGQSSSTLSGGEAQRIKLASFLAKGNKAVPTLFIFDEPTTGLHFHDVNKLIIAFNALINAGHSIIVIEHNLDVVKCADFIVDIGPKGGNEGGQIVASGTPEEICQSKESITGIYLKEKLFP